MVVWYLTLDGRLFRRMVPLEDRPAQIGITFTSGVVIMSNTNCNISHILRGDTVNNCIHEYTFM